MSSYHEKITQRFQSYDGDSFNITFPTLDLDLIKQNWVAILRYLYLTEGTLTVGPIPIRLLTSTQDNFHPRLDWREKHNSIQHSDEFREICYHFVQFLYHLISKQVVNFQRMKPNLDTKNSYNILPLDCTTHMLKTFDGFYFDNFATGLKPVVHTADCAAVHAVGLKSSVLVHLPVTGTPELIRNLDKLNIQPKTAFLAPQASNLIYPLSWVETFKNNYPDSHNHFVELTSSNEFLVRGQRLPETSNSSIFKFHDYVCYLLRIIGVETIVNAVDFLGNSISTIDHSRTSSCRAQGIKDSHYTNMPTMALRGGIWE